jgi:hypothetical protein
MKNGTGENFDVPPGEYYDIDLMQPPFNLTAPLLAFNELTCGPRRAGPQQCGGARARPRGARGRHVARSLQCCSMLCGERAQRAPEVGPTRMARGQRHVQLWPTSLSCRPASA